jgi:hypothetical protein
MLETALEWQQTRRAKTVRHVVVVSDDDDTDNLPEGTIPLEYLRQRGQAFGSTVHDIHRKTTTHPVRLPYSSEAWDSWCEHTGQDSIRKWM